MKSKGRILTILKTRESPTSPDKAKEAFKAEQKAKISGIKQQTIKDIARHLNLEAIPYGQLNTPQWKNKIEQSIKSSLESVELDEQDQHLREIIRKEIVDEILGFGPIENLLNDPDINEIMINGKDQIYIEKQGKIILTDKTFSNDEMILSMLDRILAPLGKRIDVSSPSVDARLKDGSRVHAIISPLSLTGPVVTIRKFSKHILGSSDLVKIGTLSEELAEFLKLAVELKKNIIVSGGTATGKTTLLNVLSSFISQKERIITIEDSSELHLTQKHTIYLEARPPNIEGKGEVTIRDLVKNALRMRPDRIVVGECRGGEAIDMLQAMNTGHDGCMTTLHSNSPRDTLSRLETMVLMSGFDLPLRAIREQIVSAIDLVIQLARSSTGQRYISSVIEICGTENSVITTQELFNSTKQDSGKIKIERTENIPKFF